MAILLLRPKEASDAARAALVLWGKEVVPCLFPYMVLTRLVAEQMRRSSKGMTTPILLGILGGSPSGAAALSASAGDGINRRSLYSLCALTGTISPMFLINTLGGWLNNRYYGWLLFVSHLIGAGITAALVFGTAEYSAPLFTRTDETDAKERSPIQESVLAVLGVGGCIVFFSVAAFAISSFVRLPPAFVAVFHGMLEVAGGLKAVANLSVSEFEKSLMCTALAGFNGFSIFSQNLLYLNRHGLRLNDLLMLGIVRCICSSTVFCLIWLLFA